MAHLGVKAMTERPDLDAIEQRLKYASGTLTFDWSVHVSNMLHYCRELEAENKRLREGLEFYANREHWRQGVINEDCDGDFRAVQGKLARSLVGEQP